MKSGKIYLVTNMLNNKMYIGQTTSNDGKGHGVAIRHAYKKYGKENFTYEILHDNVSLDLLDDLERKYIAEFNTLSPNGYNLESGGNANKTLSEEQKKKQSEVMKGREPWNKGKTGIYSEETKRQIIESRKANPNYPNAYKNRKPLTEEQRKNHSEKMKGKTPWNKGKKNPYSEETINKMKEYAKNRTDLSRDEFGKFIKGQE